jgi:epoxyqueuosine reductase QueG
MTILHVSYQFQTGETKLGFGDCLMDCPYKRFLDMESAKQFLTSLRNNIEENLKTHELQNANVVILA